MGRVWQHSHEANDSACQIQNLQGRASRLANVEMINKLHPLFRLDIVLEEVRRPRTLEQTCQAWGDLRNENWPLSEDLSENTSEAVQELRGPLTSENALHGQASEWPIQGLCPSPFLLFRRLGC
jgi:hypothetical protein